jgi:acetyl esterase
MKKRNKYLSIILLITSATLIAVSETKQKDTVCKKEKYTTAEEGACLDPRAYRLLKAIEKVEDNPYDNKLSKKLLDFIEPRVKKTIDTLVIYQEASVPVRIYYPSKSSLTQATPIMLFIHGGGFMYGSIEEYDMAVKKLAKITGNIVVSLDYRLAPEHPFPAALNDVEAVKDWILENMIFLGAKGKKIILIGDSAGANLATVLALKSRDEMKDHILCQILYYPPTTFVESEFPSRLHFFRDERREYFISEEFVMESKANYISGSFPEDYPYLSPLEADLSGSIAPLLIFTAEIDPIRDDGKFYFEKLNLAGQDVRYIEYEGILHGFFNFYMIFKEGLESMKIIRDYVNEKSSEE